MPGYTLLDEPRVLATTSATDLVGSADPVAAAIAAAGAAGGPIEIPVLC